MSPATIVIAQRYPNAPSHLTTQGLEQVITYNAAPRSQISWARAHAKMNFAKRRCHDGNELFRTRSIGFASAFSAVQTAPC